MASNMVVIKNPAGKNVITPYAMAKMSEDLYKASENYKPKQGVPFVNYFLYSFSIELSMKAAILSLNCTKTMKGKLKNEFSHNLEKILDNFQELVEKNLLSEKEIKVLSQINKFYKNKAIEYFSNSMLHQMLIGYKDLPNLDELQQICFKLNKFIEKNDYFKDADSTDKASGIFTVF